MQNWTRANGPLLFAHRGANQEFPENGIEAFRRAIELGADVIELDIQPTRDGVFVVFHDSTGERCAGVSRRISDCDWAEVSCWDAGWGFRDPEGAHPFRNSGLRIARFDTVLDTFPNSSFNVDVKGGSQQQIEQLVESIRGRHAEDRVLLTSFSQRRLSGIGAAGYRGALGLSRLDVARLLLTPERLSRVWGYSGKRVQIPVRSGAFDLGQQAFIDKCHRLGFAVDYWVVNDVELAAALIDRGADGIVTDEPGPMAEVFRQSPRAANWRTRRETQAGLHKR